MVDTLLAQQLMNRFKRYASKIQGSSQNWYQWYQELQSLLEQKDFPPFYWTVSSADNHWPDLHKLLSHSTSSPSRAERRQAVIDCPHITDWYFSSKLQDFVQHWLWVSWRRLALVSAWIPGKGQYICPWLWQIEERLLHLLSNAESSICMVNQAEAQQPRWRTNWAPGASHTRRWRIKGCSLPLQWLAGDYMQRIHSRWSVDYPWSPSVFSAIWAYQWHEPRLSQSCECSRKAFLRQEKCWEYNHTKLTQLDTCFFKQCFEPKLGHLLGAHSILHCTLSSLDFDCFTAFLKVSTFMLKVQSADLYETYTFAKTTPSLSICCVYTGEQDIWSKNVLYKYVKQGVGALSSVPAFNHERVPMSCLQGVDVLWANNWAVTELPAASKLSLTACNTLNGTMSMCVCSDHCCSLVVRNTPASYITIL